MKNENELPKNEFFLLDMLSNEENQLLKRIKNLNGFLYTDSFYELDPAQQILLQIEYSAMGTYFISLSERIKQLVASSSKV